MRQVFTLFFLLSGLFLAINLHGAECRNVKKRFVKKVKELKVEWRECDDEEEERLKSLESEILNVERSEGDILFKLQAKYDKKREMEIEKLDKEYGEKIAKIETLEKEQLARNRRKLERESEKIKKEDIKRKKFVEKIKDMEKVRVAILLEFENNERAAEEAFERKKLEFEDEDRKYLKEVQKEYQSEFDKVNVKISQLDSKEEKILLDIKSVDLEIEKYATAQAEKFEQYQEGIDVEREILAREYRDKMDNPKKSEEYERKVSYLDEKLARKSTVLTDAINNFNDRMNSRRSFKEENLERFRERKRRDLSRLEKKIGKAQRARDKKIAKREAKRKKFVEREDYARERRQQAFNRKMRAKYYAKLEQLEKKLPEFNLKIDSMTADRDELKIDLEEEFAEKKEGWQVRTERLENEQRIKDREITDKYDFLIIDAKTAMAKKKKMLYKKYDNMFVEQANVKQERQSLLSSLKVEYENLRQDCTGY